MTRSARRADRADDPVVVWLSGAFGYAGALLYFEDIFRGFAQSFPGAVVPVAGDFPVHRYPGLPLVPLMKFVQLGKMRRRVGEVEYQSVRRFPTPGSLLRIARLRPAAVMVTEFSFVALAGFLTAKLAGARTVVLVESDPAFRGAPASRVARTVKGVVARSADAILVSNAIGARYLTGVLGVPPEKLTIGPYLTSEPTAATPAPASTGQGPIRLLFLNSVTRRKGVDQLLRALAQTDPALRRGWQLDV